MTSRTLRVLVGTLPVEDGQTPPPVVGEIGHYALMFVEADPEVPDATVVTVRVRAEPAGSPVRGGLMWDGTARDDPPFWPTMLHGDGWTASWSAPRPVVGEVALHGTVVADLGYCALGGVSGRVTRARVVTETSDSARRRVPSLQRLRDVDRGPRWFDHGLVPPPDAPRSGWYSPVPGDPWVWESGVLVDLDLDDLIERPG